MLDIKGDALRRERMRERVARERESGERFEIHSE